MWYLKFIAILFISSISYLIIFSFIVVITLLPFGLISSIKERANSNSVLYNLISIPFFFISGSFQVYLWIMWASYIVFTIRYYINIPEVTWIWLYYLTGFGFLTAPLTYLLNKERQSATSQNEVKGIERGSNFYGVVAILSFLVFSIFPQLMDYQIISWLNNLIY